MAQQFDHPSDDSQLRTQRMTADESRAVIALWQQERVEQTSLTDHPAVPDVAEGLDITVEDAVRLLQDIRAKRLEERALALEQELAGIRLAEEERKFAEIQRQRAELRREQAEALHRQSAARQVETWRAEIRPKRFQRTPLVEQHFVHKNEAFERHSTETQEGLDTPSYLWAAFIFAFALFVILSNTLK